MCINGVICLCNIQAPQNPLTASNGVSVDIICGNAMQ